MRFEDTARRGRWTLPLLVLLAFAATGISLMLTSYHLSGGKEPWALFSLACDAQKGGCASVLASPWASGPAGIPTALLGAAYFGALGLWYLIVGAPSGAGRRWQLLPLVLNVLGVLFSVFLISVMVTSVHAVCWWCLLSHLINFALLFLGWRLYRQAPLDGDSWPPARLGFAGILLLIAWAAVCLQGLAVSSLRASAAAANDYARTFYEDADLQRYLQQRAAAQAIPIRPDDPVRGNPQAAHTVVVFSDFECPGCRSFAGFFESEVLPAVGDRLKVVYKHFPLNPECNRNLAQVVHPSACAAAEAAEAARQLGGSEAFWKMHDALFQAQDTLGQAPWPALAAQAGVDPAQLAAIVASHAHRARIQEDADLGARMQLRQTPTVFFDGRPLADWQRLDLWRSLTQ